MEQGIPEQLLHVEYAHSCRKEGSILADNPAGLGASRAPGTPYNPCALAEPPVADGGDSDGLNSCVLLDKSRLNHTCALTQRKQIALLYPDPSEGEDALIQKYILKYFPDFLGWTRI